MAISVAFLVVATALAAGGTFETGRSAVALSGSWFLILAGGRIALGDVRAVSSRSAAWLLGLAMVLILSGLAWPPAVTSLLSPRTGEVYQLAFGELATSRWRPFTLSRWESMRTLALGSTYVLVAVSCAAWPWTLRVVHRILATLVVLAVIESLYAFLQQTMDAPRLLWFACLEHTSCTGTLLNRNHFAGLLEMALPLLAGAIGWELRRSLPLDEQSRHRSFSEQLVLVVEWALDPARGRLLVLVALAVLLVVGLALSSSRSAFFFSLGAVGVMAWLRPRHRGAVGRAPAVIVAVGLACAALVWLSFPQLASRLSLDDPTRVQLWRDSFDVVRAFPALGVGLGNFAAVFPLFRSRTGYLWGFPIDHAHNDYLEWFGEVGVPAGFLGLLLLAGVVRRALHVLRQQVLPAVEAWTLWGCTTAVLTMLLHSLTDFNLHTPANALVFSVLIGYMGRLSADGVRSTWRIPRAAGLLALVLGLVWAVVSWRSAGAAAVYASVRPDLPLADLTVAEPVLSTADSVRLLREALLREPRSPAYAAALGNALLTSSELLSGSERQARLAEARETLQRSLDGAPLQPRVLLDLASLALAEGDSSGSRGLVARAVALAGYDVGFRLDAAAWIVERRTAFTGADREWARDMVESALAFAEVAPRLREDRARLAAASASMAEDR